MNGSARRRDKLATFFILSRQLHTVQHFFSKLALIFEKKILNIAMLLHAKLQAFAMYTCTMFFLYIVIMFINPKLKFCLSTISMGIFYHACFFRIVLDACKLLLYIRWQISLYTPWQILFFEGSMANTLLHVNC